MIDISNQVEVCGSASIYRGYSLCGGIGLEIEIQGEGSATNQYSLIGTPNYYVQSILEGKGFSYLEYELKGRSTFTIFVTLEGELLVGNSIPKTPLLRRFKDMPLSDCSKEYITQFMQGVNPSTIQYNIDDLLSRARIYLPEFNSIPFNQSLEYELDKQRKIVTIPIEYFPKRAGKPWIWGVSLILYEGYPASIIINEGYNNNTANRFIIDELVYKGMIDFIWSLFCVESNIGYAIFKPNDPPSLKINKDYSILNRLLCNLKKDNNIPVCH